MLPKPFTRKDVRGGARVGRSLTVSRGKAAIALRYGLAPACIGIAVLLHVSPVGALFHPMGLFIIGVLAAAWFGGAGPGVLAAFLSAISLPHLIAIAYPLSVSYPLLAGFFDLPRFVTLGLTGAAVGWGRTSYRRAESALRERNRAEQAQRQSQQRYERVLDGAEVGDWEWDVVNGDYFVSARMREMLEMPPDLHFASREAFLAQVPFHPDDREFYLEDTKRNIAIGVPTVEHEYRVVLKSGAVRWMRVRGKSTRNAQGVVTHFSGSLVDITERKLAEGALRRGEAALRLSEERYALAMEASAEGHFDTDLETDETFISARLAEIYGFPRRARIANRIEWVEQIPFHPDDRHVLADLLRPDWEDPTRDFYEFQYRIVPRPGETRWIHARGMVTRDAQGRPRRRVGVVADITARKLAEEALRLSEERYALALQVTEEGHFDWKVQTDQIFVSAKALRVMNVPQDLEYRTRSDIMARVRYHPDDWPRISEEWRAALAGRGLEHEFEYRILRGEEPRSIRGRWKVFRDADGVAQRVIGVVSDVTEMRKMEQELRRAQRLEAMGTLAGGIAHDFNNILGAILGYGEIALRDAPKGSLLARDLDSIIVAGERGRALVDRVLAFSRSAVGERVPVHVEKAVREALGLLRAKLPPDVTLHAELRAGRAAMLGDATQVHQVLMNLATNAVQAMAAGGTLRVSLSAARLDAPRTPTVGIMPAGDYLILEVADTGTGIAPEIVDRIFDPFFTTKDVGTGTGLGLSLVHGIVAALGGAIDVASAPGAGSTFSVFLPRSGDALDSSRKEEPELPRGDGQRVLVVDDEEPLVKLATRTLEELGYAPVGFTSSVAALAAFRADPQRFDAVITDERMPGMSGLALIREVRGIRDRIPVVLMTGFVGGTVASAAREGGAEEVLKKPLLARDLAASLARVCTPRTRPGRP